MSGDIFQNCRIYIVPNGLLKKRIKLFEDQVTKHGGKILSDAKSTMPTHIIVEENCLTNLNQIRKILKTVELDYENLKCEVVGTLWLSRCLKDNNLLDTDDFKFKDYQNKVVIEDQVVKDEPPTKMKRTQVISDDRCSDDSCDRKLLSMNEMVIEQFEKLADAYRASGDKWRIVAYDKAIASLKSYKKPLTNINDLKSLTHMSAKMLDKILEIIECGSCSKVEEICDDEKTRILNTFEKVWGVGFVTAQTLYQKGYRTLEDLRTKANLTRQQELGLKYYHEIQERIPRYEVQKIVEYVEEAAQDLDQSLQVMACGSFRRGKAMCGDIDVLVITQNLTHTLHKILAKLRRQNFLIDGLNVSKEKTSTTYLGLCRLPGENSKIRRLDIFIASGDVIGCALIHHTGSALFNRGLRTHAIKMNMKLNKFNLICNGKVLPTPTEESVFEHLNLDYKQPEERETFFVCQ